MNQGDDRQAELQLQEQARQLFQRGDLSPLLEFPCERIVTPDIRAGVLQYMAAAAMRLSRFSLAEEHFREALGCCNPAQAGPILLNLSRALVQQGKNQEAEKLLAGMVEQQPGFQQAVKALLNIYSGQEQEAKIRELEKRVAPNLRYIARAKLAEVLASRGKLESARSLYREAVIDDANINCDYAYPYVQIERLVAGDAVAQKLQRVAGNNSLSPAVRMMASYSLGTIADRQGNYEEASRHFVLANQLEKGQRQYDYSGVASFLKRLRLNYAEIAGDIEPVDESIKPVFIVGLPRSGSTLVEQHLGMLDGMRSGGEMPHWTKSIFSVTERKFGKVEKHVQQSASFTASDWQEAGRIYLQLVREDLGNAVSCFTDKLLPNFFFSGYFTRLFPRAVVVDVRKERMNAALSCYVRKFDDPAPYANDLNDVLAFYDGYCEMMAFWQGMLGDRLVSIGYEEFVGNHEEKARELVTACGFEWVDRVLQFDRSVQSVKTTSKVQVRQGMYDKVVDRWASYEPFLGHLVRQP